MRGRQGESEREEGHSDGGREMAAGWREREKRSGRGVW